MKYLFESPENVAKLLKEVDEWYGTPWQHLGGTPGYHRAVKKVRGNCVHIVVAIYENCGFIQPVWLPIHAANTGVVREEDAMQSLVSVLQSFVTDERMVKVEDRSGLIVGDILTFRYAARDHHLGIWLGGLQREFAHCSGSSPAAAVFQKSSLNNQQIAAGLRGVYRLLAEKEQS